MKKLIGVVTAAVLTMALSTAAYAGNGWQRVPDSSPWVGSYVKEDGQMIVVHSADARHVYADYFAYSEDGWNWNPTTVQLNSSESGVSIGITDEGIRYSLQGRTIVIDQSAWGGGFREGNYVKNFDTWSKDEDGSWCAWDAAGNRLTDAVTDDGWVTDHAGKWDISRGMGPFIPGTYQTIWDNDAAIAQETWFFSAYTDLDEESMHLKDAADLREVGTVSYYATGADGNEMYKKEDMRIYNSMNGYVIKDAAGEEFGWFHPVGTRGQIMFQPYGAEAYHALNLIYRYES